MTIQYEMNSYDLSILRQLLSGPIPLADLKARDVRRLDANCLVELVMLPAPKGRGLCEQVRVLPEGRVLLSVTA